MLRFVALVQKVKGSTSHWIKKQDSDLAAFSWQAGYAAFSVGHRDLPAVTRYIASQQRHHGKIDFKCELRELLAEGGLDFDERYLWD